MEVDNNLTAERSLEMCFRFLSHTCGRIMVGRCGICFGLYYG